MIKVKVLDTQIEMVENYMRDNFYMVWFGFEEKIPNTNSTILTIHYSRTLNNRKDVEKALAELLAN